MRIQSARGIGVALLVLLVGAACGGSDPPDDPDAAPASDAPPGPDAPDACTSCTPDGSVVTCGDGTIDFANGEQCDDGNVASGDGCDMNCQIEAPASCGDGNVDLANGEQCDDGNVASGDGCSAACLIEAPASCGDGALDLASGEQCDDGNTIGGDGCSAACQFEPVGATCGDATVDSNEVCDDGNVANGDGCNPTCNLTGTVSLFLGMPGMGGFMDGDVTVAMIGGNGSLTVDADYLYFGDTVNRRIRRIHIATGTMLTIAGDGTNGATNNTVGTLASFASIEALATDGTTLWVADGANHLIRAIDLTSATFAVTTVAGTVGVNAHTDGIGPAAAFQDLRGLTYYAGFVYHLDAVGGTLRRFNPITTEVITIAGAAGMTTYLDGFGTAARFISPRYIASNNSGMIYISDTNGSTLRAYNTITTEVTTFAGDGTQGYLDGVGIAAQVHRPRGMTSDGTSIYWVEFNRHTVRQGVLATQSVTTLAGQHCWPGVDCPGYANGAGTAALFDNPWSIAFHYPTNSLFVVDGGNFVIRRIQ